MSKLMQRIGACLAVALLLAGCGGGGGSGGSPAPPAPTFTDPVLYSTAASASLPSAVEIAAVTHHQLTLNGATLNYTATAGHLTANALTSSAPEASFFYVAYTLDGANAATRPVTFFYNGGPGSSTVWLHLGSYGPKRLVTGDPATTAPTPFPLVDNTESLIDVSDLVFVDAVGTGLSEAIAPNVNQTFWSVDADAAVFRDFVIRYLAANNRAGSPKFLFGESYGTTRSAVLANILESAGVSLNGAAPRVDPRLQQQLRRRPPAGELCRLPADLRRDRCVVRPGQSESLHRGAAGLRRADARAGGRPVRPRGHRVPDDGDCAAGRPVTAIGRDDRDATSAAGRRISISIPVSISPI
jgi:hypothetical protein